MGRGCLGFGASLLGFGVWILGYVFYLYFGPTNPLIGFAFGAAMMAAMLFLFDRLLPSVALDAPRAVPLPNDALTQGFRFAAIRFGRVVGWGLTLLLGGLTLLCAVFAVAMLYKGEASAGTLGVFCGTLAVLTYFVWTYIAKANSA